MQAINFALTLPVDEPGPRLLLILISHHINWKTGEMYVSQEDLAIEARMSSRSVRTHLATLEEAGLIVRMQTRNENGRRGVDRIILVGYLEWQDALYNGGTIPSPESRRKAPKSQPENSSSGDDANRKKDIAQPENQREPTGNCFPVHNKEEPSSNHSEPLARTGARTTRSAARPALEVKAGDMSWSEWLEAIEEKLGADARRSAARLGKISVTARWPREGVPMPSIEIVRDPTGEAA